MKIVTLFLVLIVLVAVYEVNCVTRHRHKPEKKALQKPSVTRHRLAKNDPATGQPQVEVTEVPSNQPAAGSTAPTDPTQTTGAAPALGSAAPALGSAAPALGSAAPTDSTLPVGDNSTSTALPGSGAGGAWRSLLKPETNQSPEEKKKDAQLCAKRGGIANMIKQNLTAGYRDLSMTLKTYSVGFSAYLFKNYFNVFFKDSFISDFQALKQGFFTAPTLSAEALRDKLPDFHWDMSDDPLSTAKLVLKQHDINENGSLNFKEFSWYAIKETSPYNKDFKCQSCLETIRKELHEFFEFVDCNSNGSISSEELYRALNKLQAKKAADSRETNDFVLKADPRKRGFLKKVDFLQAVMKGLWEQLITDDGVGSI